MLYLIKITLYTSLQLYGVLPVECTHPITIRLPLMPIYYRFLVMSTLTTADLSAHMIYDNDLGEHKRL